MSRIVRLLQASLLVLWACGRDPLPVAQPQGHVPGPPLPSTVMHDPPMTTLPPTMSWSREDSGTTAFLHASWGTSTDLFLAGESGVILRKHRPDGAWTVYQTDPSHQWFGLWGP